jgi:transposase
VSLSGIPAINTFEEACLRVAELEKQKADLEEKVRRLEEMVRLANQRQFGPSSEKTPSGQEVLDLFNEVEVIADTGEPAVEQISYTRPKNKRSREQWLGSIPRETIEHRLTEEEQVCACCSGPLHEIGEETTYRLDVVPAQFTLQEHVQYKYSCRVCAKDPEAKTPVVEAPTPTNAFPGSLASPSLVSYIVCQKYLEGLPLYRQQQAFERIGIELSRQTMANWVIAAALVLQPFFDRLKRELLLHDILYADETTLQVLHESGREPQTKSYLWLYRTGRYPTQGPIVLYEYRATRAGEHARKFIGDFEGFLLTDGYDGYEKMPGRITNAGCWAHARRYFTEALAALPKGFVIAKGGKTTLAHAGLDFCNKLFAIEHDLRDLSPEERHTARMVRSAPLLERFRTWLDANADTAIAKGHTGKAIGYCRNQWAKLIVFLQDGRLEIDNNRSERSIKPFVIGRKNWLFSNTPRGAAASAVLYSIVETAKENRLNPFQYLTYLFENLPPSGTGANLSQEFLDGLMPWSQSLSASCRVPAKSKYP